MKLAAMSPMQKVALFGATAMAPFLIALAVWLVVAVLGALRAQKFMSEFQTINETKPPLSIAQVEQLMGPPTRIDHSESTDQAINGDVYHYPERPPGQSSYQDFKVIFVNGVVFRTELLPPAKS
jgi:hypothetical protein